MKIEKTFTIIFRIIVLPFIAITALIGALRLWLLWVINFIIYGGESICYTKKMTRKTIQDVFQKLIEKDHEVWNK